MGVGDLDAEGDALVAEFAFGHVAYLLAMRIAFQKASTDIITDIPAECKHFFQKLATKKILERGAVRLRPSRFSSILKNKEDQGGLAPLITQ